jgi:hypothetical protein
MRVTVISAPKIKSYQWGRDFLGMPYTEEAQQGKIFVLVDALVESIGKESIYVNPYDFSMTDSQNYKYDPALYFGDDDLPSTELYQGQQAGGKVLFEVPEGAIGLKVVYDFGFWETKLAMWQL